eukprot:2489086-Alexandrium_andersonii.AAC.1
MGQVGRRGASEEAGRHGASGQASGRASALQSTSIARQGSIPSEAKPKRANKPTDERTSRTSEQPTRTYTYTL